MTASQPQPIYLKDYQPIDFSIEYINLYIDLYEDHVVVRSELKCIRQANVVTPLVLNGQGLELRSCTLDGRVLSSSEFSVTDKLLTIDQVPAEFVLETVCHIKPQDNKTLMGLYRSRHNFCTQCEAEGFRHITYYFDRPDVMTRFTTTISADKSAYPYLLSNGNLIDRGDGEDGRHWVKWHDPSLKPCYLFALVAGDFDLIEDQFVTLSGKAVDLKFYLEKGFKDQGDYAMQSLKRAMNWDEQQYGREYDLDIYMVVAVSDFNMGAMENKGLNVFNTKYVLAKPETATDMDYVAIEDVIGHEYFHNWTGNRITCRDWFQLTLKEGLTVFRDQTFSEDMTSQAVARIGEVNVVRNGQFSEDAGPLAHPIRPESYIEINNFYTATVYRKGAEVIRMIQTLITPEGFRQGMDLYFERHDGQAVTTEDFVACMQDASGKDLTQFKRWYSQAGTPVLQIKSDYQAQDQTFTLVIKQSCPATPGQESKLPFHLPFSVGLLDQKGQVIKANVAEHALADSGTCVLEITESEHKFVFEGVADNPVVSLNRGFSAPVKIRYDVSLDDLAKLVKWDVDAVARWDAANQLASRLILDQVKGEQFNTLIQEVFTYLLADTVTDQNLLAQLVCLPGVNYMIQLGDTKDVLAIHQAREYYKGELASLLEPNWLEHYEREHTAQHYEFSIEKMGQRAWKNVCLNYLVATGNPTYAKLAYDQLLQADNMTDSMAALTALNHQDSELRDQALVYFYDKWQDEPLVVNKWLSVQAAAPLTSTLQRVQSLIEHAAFDAKNPNNIYALVCSFGVNLPCFHVSSGQGYEFIANQVIAINAYNPQVAARVLAPLTRWPEFGESAAVLMRQQLQRIAQQPNLSSDIYEVIQKSLV